MPVSYAGNSPASCAGVTAEWCKQKNMKREELKKVLANLGVDESKIDKSKFDDSINAIMNLHGNTVNANNEKNAAAIKQLQEQLERAKKTNFSNPSKSKNIEKSIDWEAEKREFEQFKANSLKEIRDEKIKVQAEFAYNRWQQYFNDSPVVTNGLKEALINAICSGKSENDAVTEFAVANKSSCINSYNNNKAHSCYNNQKKNNQLNLRLKYKN